MEIKAVLFDMDGVIVNTEPLHRLAYYTMFDEVGIKVDEELYNSYTGQSTNNVCSDIKRRFNLSQDVNELIRIKRAHFKDHFDHDKNFDLLPGVLDLIQFYHKNNIKLVLASSASRNTINWVFERFGLNPYFIDIISGAELAESKPHPEIFLKAAELAKTTIEHCVVIEDSTNGILAAKEAGIYCIAYKSTHSKNQDYALADRLIERFEEAKILHYN